MKRIIQTLLVVAIVCLAAMRTGAVLWQRAGHRVLCTGSDAEHDGFGRHRLADANDRDQLLSGHDDGVLCSGDCG